MRAPAQGHRVPLLPGSLATVHEVVALALPGGPAFVDELRRVWDAGDAVLPVDARLPPNLLRLLLETLAPTVLVDTHGRHRLERGRPAEDDDAVVVATSGATGEPKGVVHTHRAMAASARATNAALETDPDSDRFLCCLPLHHVAGLAVVTRALASGTPLEVLPRFDAAEVEAAARTRGATLTSLVPTTLDRIDPSGYRRVVVGGATPPEGLPANVMVSYGLTETGSAVCLDGRPLAGAEVRIVDGQIQVRGPMLLRAYRDGTDPRGPGGWLATGDLGELDADGRLTVHGRADDLIITGGENVWPAPVERVLVAHPGVADAAVVGRPDPEWGQRIVALVVPADPGAPPDLAELRAWVKQHLPAHAAPRQVEWVDLVPRTSLGKVRRHLL